MKNHENVPKKHDVLLLQTLVNKHIQIDNEDVLEDLNSLYIDSRYPGSFGLLPNGKPTLQDAKVFYEFAVDIFDRTCALLKVDQDKIKK